jgi:hypothetical protein
MPGLNVGIMSMSDSWYISTESVNVCKELQTFIHSASKMIQGCGATAIVLALLISPNHQIHFSGVKMFTHNTFFCNFESKLPVLETWKSVCITKWEISMPYDIEVTRHQLRTFLALRPAMHFFKFCLAYFQKHCCGVSIRITYNPNLLTRFLKKFKCYF